MKNKTINDAIQKFADETYGRGCYIDRELALGFLRYEALRKLTPRKFSELHVRNLRGENFDEMVDKLVVEND